MKLDARRSELAIAAVLMSLGVCVRAAPYFANRSLWIDEANLANNIAGRSFLDLARPLDFDQVAPVPFLWAEKAMTLVFGVNEPALRLLPFVASIVLLPVLWRLARRLAGATAGCIGLAIASVSPLLVRYADEVKQYGVDALVTAVLLLLTLDVLAFAGGARAWRRLLVFGAVALLLSHTAVLVLAGVGAALACSTEVRRVSARGLLGVAFVWGGVFAASYVALMAAPERSAYLRRFWEARFLGPANPHLPGQALNAAGEIVFAFFAGRVGVSSRALALLALLLTLATMILGAAALFRRGGMPVLALVVAPLAATLAASALELYPVGARQLLFAAPLLLTLTGAGAASAARVLPQGAFAASLAIGLALFPAARETIERAVQPPLWEHARPLVTELLSRRKPEEPIYVLARAAPSWLFYSMDWRKPDLERAAWFARTITSGGPAFENAPSRGRRVTKEGRELARPFRGAPELIGIATGMETRHGLGVQRAEPDPGWVENEVQRIREAAHPAVWIFFSQAQDASILALFGALRAAGTDVAFARREERGGALLIRFREGPEAQRGGSSLFLTTRKGQGTIHEPNGSFCKYLKTRVFSLGLRLAERDSQGEAWRTPISQSPGPRTLPSPAAGIFGKPRPRACRPSPWSDGSESKVYHVADASIRRGPPAADRPRDVLAAFSRR